MTEVDVESVLKNMFQEVQGLQIPDNAKEALLGAIDSTIAQLEIKPKTTTISYEEVQEVVPKYVRVRCYDEKYVVFDKTSMLKLLKAVLSYLMKYKKGVFDCDDFAKLVDAYMCAFHGCNSTGQCMVALYREVGFIPEIIGLHMCNMPIVINEDGDLEALLYEPQIGEYLNGNCLSVNGVNIYYAPFKVMYY